jgi:hypothetical protein
MREGGIFHKRHAEGNLSLDTVAILIHYLPLPDLQKRRRWGPAESCEGVCYEEFT